MKKLETLFKKKGDSAIFFISTTWVILCVAHFFFDLLLGILRYERSSWFLPNHWNVNLSEHWRNLFYLATTSDENKNKFLHFFKFKSELLWELCFLINSAAAAKWCLRLNSCEKIVLNTQALGYVFSFKRVGCVLSLNEWLQISDSRT